MHPTFHILYSAFVVLLLVPLAVRAESFSIEKFSATVLIRPNAQIEVEETIKVEFSEERHGIFRNIPVRYTDDKGISRSIRLKVRGVRDETDRAVPYSVRRDGNDLVIKIGDPDRLVFGPKTYRITYTVDRAILFFDDHDELYWNVTGTDWPVPINSASVLVGTPAPLGDTRVICFTGPPGSTAGDCTQAGVDDKTLVVARDFLTVAFAWPKGYVAEPTALDRVRWFLADNGIAFLPAAILALLVHLWWTRGRDARGRKTIIAEYDPPAGMTPGEVGTLVDATVHPRDFSATVVNLAVKGYLLIVEEGQDGIFKKKSYALERLKPTAENLEEHEKVVLDKLFEKGMRVELKAGKAKEAFNKFSADLYATLARENYFVRNPQIIRGVFFAVGAVLVVLGFILGDAWGLLATGSFAISGVLFILFAPIMPKKTKKGTLAYEQALGFKEFLKVAEKYRLQWAEKERIFEKYLPYAMVFGVVDQWSRALAGTMREPPSWYSGSFPSGWNAVAFASSLDSFTRASNGASGPAKGAGAGSSGFGGGGFSGGGFGGGGGGSW